MTDAEYCPDCGFPVETSCHCSTREWPQLADLRAALAKEKERAEKAEYRAAALDEQLQEQDHVIGSLRTETEAHKSRAAAFLKEGQGAFDERDALRAECERLKAERDDALQTEWVLNNETKTLRATLAEREAEIERLQKMLTERHAAYESARKYAEGDLLKLAASAGNRLLNGFEAQLAEARAALAKAQEEIASLRRVNHRRLCGCEESAGVFGCGLNCPCRCHALHERIATARAEALEDAAKVVEDLDMPDMWDGSIGRTDDGSAFRRDAVAAIRALASDTKGET